MDTGYRIVQNGAIVGPDGQTGYRLDDEGFVYLNGELTAFHVEDGHFYRTRKVLLIFGISSPTGHTVSADGSIVGAKGLAPWTEPAKPGAP